MIPSEEYKALCEKHQERLRELWGEPKFGDWVIDGDGRLGIVMGGDSRLHIKHRDYLGSKHHDKASCIPLFTLRQLIDMLEEEGWRIGKLVDRANPEYRAMYERIPDDSPRRWVADIHCCTGLRNYTLYYKGYEQTQWSGVGADPETAMLKALIEVYAE